MYYQKIFLNMKMKNIYHLDIELEILDEINEIFHKKTSFNLICQQKFLQKTQISLLINLKPKKMR